MRHAALLFVASCAWGQLFPFPGPAVSSAGGGSCTPVSGFAHCRVLTIDHTQVGGSTLTSFPVLVTATLGGSRIQSASCFDVVFTSDGGGTTKIPWEQETCAQSSGAIVDWVGVPSISSGANTTIYVSYDNAGIGAAQNTGALAPSNVWASSYGPVYHLGPSLSLADSTSGGITASNSGATSGPGQIDGAAALNGSAVITGHQWAAYSAFTVSYWINWNNVTGYQYAVSDIDGFGTHFISTLYNTPNVRVFITTSGGTNNTTGASTVSTGLWYHVASVYDGSHVTTYLNGSQDSQMAVTGAFVFTAGSLEKVGGNPTAGHFVSGTMDEYEFSTTARSTGWITAEYNSQKPSSTFLTVGAEI